VCQRLRIRGSPEGPSILSDPLRDLQRIYGYPRVAAALARASAAGLTGDAAVENMRVALAQARQAANAAMRRSEIAAFAGAGSGLRRDRPQEPLPDDLGLGFED
jgi:hypothetical protein